MGETQTVGMQNRVAAAGLYVHVPFCSSVCPYCDFAVTLAGEDRRREYVDAVVAECGRWREWGPAFDTIYLGGGTPSSLSAQALNRMLETIRRTLPVASDTRVFLEANPEDLTTESVAAWRDLGVGTVSLGVQSLDDDALAFLGRRHRGLDSERAIRDALEAGFATVSADLIFGLPGQGPSVWRRELERAAALGVQHLSCYQLTVEPGTVFGRRAARAALPSLPSTDAQGELLRLTHAVLADHGFAGYEVSNFARGAEHVSRHNVKYWTGAPYLGLGPSAHSFVVGRRWWNQRKLRVWARAVLEGGSPMMDEEILTPAQQALEALMLGLRTAQGVDLVAVEARTGLALVDVNSDRIAAMAADGLILEDGRRILPTTDGMAVAEGLARSFVIPGLDGPS